jgi:hypothetical protein
MYTEQNAIDAALQFVEDDPTYSWDGIEGMIELVEAHKTMTTDAVWEGQIDSEGTILGP